MIFKKYSGETFRAERHILSNPLYWGGEKVENQDSREWDIDDFVFGDEGKTVSQR